MRQYILIGLYLLAIIIANLTTAWFGPNWSIINAFLLIGLDLTTRDYLHETWRTGRWWKMVLLIAFGSLISWLLNKDAGKIALASLIAFASAGLVDWLVYSVIKKSHIWKVNGSNVCSSAVDSFVFPAIAFGFPLMWPVMLGQFVAKVFGGFIWYWILRRFNALVTPSPK